MIYFVNKKNQTPDVPPVSPPPIVEPTVNSSTSPVEIKLTDHNTHIAFSDKITFGEGEIIAAAASVPEVLIIDDDIYVYFVDAYAAHQGDGVNLYYMVSLDGGLNWSEGAPIQIEGLVAGMEPVDPSMLDLGGWPLSIVFL